MSRLTPEEHWTRYGLRGGKVNHVWGWVETGVCKRNLHAYHPLDICAHCFDQMRAHE